ncbi:Abi family protein [Pseudomonas parafulva]|uniref:Abi family protein n=1 Tax=Pseudomonas parafulva TaxID=157782 RepID=UPI0019D40A81|nr:Abi family protein [Pseudomonas parafulva]
MTVPHHNVAVQALGNIGYFRFKIYLTPFFDDVTQRYEPGATFENGLEVYRFDEDLRGYLLSVISRIEVKLRTKIDQVATGHTRNPFWYLDDALFTSDLNSLRGLLASQFQNSKIPFAIHFKSNYFNTTNPNFKQMPPFWMISELATLGNIKTIYSAINKSGFGVAPNNKLDALAGEFGAKNLKALNGWITLLRDVRNVCAHHNRAWNSNYRQPSDIVNLLSVHHQPSNPNRIYLVLALLHVMSKNLSLGVDIRHTVQSLINKYPSVQTKLNSAGFPNGWDVDPFWN